MNLRFGEHEFELGGKYLTDELRESNDCLDDVEALRSRMAEDGYLLLRGLHDRDQVLAARREILEKLVAQGVLDPQAPLMEAVRNPADDQERSVTVRGKDDLKGGPALQAVVEGEPVMRFFERFLGGAVLTFDFKWLRVVGPGGGATIHYDIVYMGRGTKNLYTCWSPLGEVPIDMGPLVLCLGSHQLEQIKATYGTMDVDKDLIQGIFTNDPAEMVDRFGCRWATTRFEPGDVVIMSMFLMHASLNNLTDKIRISVDTRYQLASEPVDPRWVGAQPLTHPAFWKPDAKLEPLAKSREKWGV